MQQKVCDEGETIWRRSGGEIGRAMSINASNMQEGKTRQS
jgi:hypothetical protein